MKGVRWLVMLGIVMLAGSASIVVVRCSSDGPPAVLRQGKREPSVAGSTGSKAITTIVETNVGKSKSFRTLRVLEQNAILSEIRRRPLREIFDLWQRAGAIEKDLMKQGAIATTMAYALRQQSPSQELLDDMWTYVVDSRNSLRERGAVLGIFGGAKTVEGVEFLLKAAANLTDSQLRRGAVEQIADTGDLWGDGSYHEERSPPLEKAWQTASDPDLLSRTAIAMAKIGASSALEALLKAALDGSSSNGGRKRAALLGLEEVYSRNATPPVAALLARQAGANQASGLSSKILVKIGDEAAAKALTNWFQSTDASAVELAASSVARTRTPILLDAWKVSVASNQAFRSEEIRVAMREALERYYKGISIER